MSKPTHRGNCPQCPQTEDVLSNDTVLYQGFGGYHVERDGEIYYRAMSDMPWEDVKTLADIEKDIANERTNAEYKIVLNNPLRRATWVRKSKNNWVLTETNEGFA